MDSIQHGCQGYEEQQGPVITQQPVSTNGRASPTRLERHFQSVADRQVALLPTQSPLFVQRYRAELQQKMSIPLGGCVLCCAAGCLAGVVCACTNYAGLQGCLAFTVGYGSLGVGGGGTLLATHPLAALYRARSRSVPSVLPENMGRDVGMGRSATVGETEELDYFEAEHLPKQLTCPGMMHKLTNPVFLRGHAEPYSFAYVNQLIAAQARFYGPNDVISVSDIVPPAEYSESQQRLVRNLKLDYLLWHHFCRRRPLVSDRERPSG
ncbi:hypothetical protein [Parendozoicomonas haliclonae]|nr:hypothetical protein [Parendozoicomonas haliclonae]